MRKKFDLPGCYVDGVRGHGAIRLWLANEMDALGQGALAAELREPMSDDASEEDDALVYLQTVTEDGLTWAFVDGELVLDAEVV